jgi:hypothetical protein
MAVAAGKTVRLASLPSSAARRISAKKASRRFVLAAPLLRLVLPPVKRSRIAASDHIDGAATES